MKCSECGEPAEMDDICHECCDHGDVDFPCCLICGADVAEDMMARAYDQSKDYVKYGE